MSKLLNKVLNFVGWESQEEEYIPEQENEEKEEEIIRPQFLQTHLRKHQNKIVNIHSSNQFKVVVVQPDDFDDAKEICDHLKNKKPVVINLENMDKEPAQRIVDFLSGSVYALDGSIQKVATSILLIAPNNVDVTGDFRDELRSRGVFPWLK